MSKFLKSIEYLLIILIIGCLGYIAYFFMMKNNADEIPLKVSVEKEITAPTTEEIAAPDLKPYDFYAKQINARDIFTLPTTVVVKPVVPTGMLPDNLKIVGIVLGQPEQVIIEDKNAHATYFIEKSHSEAGISIDHIKDDKVFLNYQGQSIEVGLKGNEINVAK